MRSSRLCSGSNSSVMVRVARLAHRHFDHIAHLGRIRGRADRALVVVEDFEACTSVTDAGSTAPRQRRGRNGRDRRHRQHFANPAAGSARAPTGCRRCCPPASTPARRRRPAPRGVRPRRSATPASCAACLVWRSSETSLKASALDRGAGRPTPPIISSGLSTLRPAPPVPCGRAGRPTRNWFIRKPTAAEPSCRTPAWPRSPCNGAGSAA
jgi:hypothetical protein